MRIESYNLNTLNREPIAELSFVTIVTSQGEFSFKEEPDGSLTIHENTHLNLAIRPRTANSMTISAVAP